MPFRFGAPLALLLLVPLVPLLLIIVNRSLAGLPPIRRRVSLGVRLFVLACLVFALAGMEWVRFSRELTVFLLVDQSHSVPPGARREAVPYVNQALRNAGKHDSAGIIVFGRDAGIERFPEPVAGAGDWAGDATVMINRSRTNMAGAVRLALAAFPENSRKRIVLLSDGCENAGAVLEQADVARSLDCPIDVMMVNYEHTSEVLVEKAVAPPRVRVGEPFEVRAVIVSLQDCPADISLSLDGHPISAGRPIALAAGKEVISFPFPDGLPEPGPYTFGVSIRSPEYDTITANNAAVAHTWVEGKGRKVLMIDSNPDDLALLAEALAADDIEAVVGGPEALPSSLAALRRYDCLVLSNCPAYRLAAEQLGMIEGAVKELGMGLVLVGGEHSFGAGGYRNTPIEDCSPVDFDIRQKRVMPKGAIVLVLDAAEDANANRWAIEVAHSAVKVLSFHDEVGIISSGQWHLPLTEVGDKTAVADSIDKMTVYDNDAFDSLLATSLNGLKASDAAAKHVLIMTDGGHSAYQPQTALKKRLVDERVSVSMVVFRPHVETEKVVVPPLKAFAEQFGGRFYYPKNASELPQIFFKEATLISRSLIHEQPFNPVMRLTTDPIRGFDGFPQLKGYVLTTAKPRALVPIVRSYHDQKLNEVVHDPVFAHWNYGLGKVAAFTSDAKNRWGADWAAWEGYKKFWPQIVRWALPASAVGSATVRSSVDIRNGEGSVSVDILDEAGAPINFLDLRGSVLTPRADAFGRFESEPLDLVQVGPGRYAAEFPAAEAGAYFVSLSYNGNGPRGEEVSGVHTAAAAVPYPAEYRDLTTNVPLLRKLVEQTGGRFLEYDTNIFERTMRAASASQPIWPLLLLIAVAAFPGDVALRKITVNWRRIGERIIGYITGLKPTARLEPAAESGMGQLLRRKQETREVLGGAKPEILRAQPEHDPGAPDAGTTAHEPAPAQAESKPRPQQEPQQVNVYTSRLMQAKKRARQKNE